jgi:hypothetical protein
MPWWAWRSDGISLRRRIREQVKGANRSMIEVRSVAEIKPRLMQVRAAADIAARRLRDLSTSCSDGLAVLRALKFDSFGRHPLEERDLNLVEQINQTWTCLVSLQALPLLFERHPEAGGFGPFFGQR